MEMHHKSAGAFAGGGRSELTQLLRTVEFSLTGMLVPVCHPNSNLCFSGVTGTMEPV